MNDKNHMLIKEKSYRTDPTTNQPRTWPTPWFYTGK